jgi:adenine-specific DNA-methyltransferase
MQAKPSNASELGYSADCQAQRQQELLALIRLSAPEVISDNQINFGRLKELLGEDAIAPFEHYELNWAGKSAARREIQRATSHTLLPAATNPPQAPHMLIEGENLEVLRVLQKSYYGKVKMIYIDPPYNTGNDSFVYPDDYSETLDEYQKRTGEKNAAGHLNKQSLWKKNSKESGQYHSAWLSMMYPRLYLARNLLRDDGVIFISIDDNEVANLKLLCDEVFGAENFVAQLAVQLNPRGRHLDKFVAKTHESILVFVKDEINIDAINGLEKEGRMVDEYKRTDAKGQFRPLGLRNRNQAFNPITRRKLYYPLYVNPENGSVSLTNGNSYTIEVWPDAPDGTKTCWTWGTDKVSKESFLLFAEQTSDEWRIFRKDYLFDEDGELAKTLAKSLWTDSEITNDYGRKAVKDLLGSAVMDFPKSPELLTKIIQMGANKESLILDFFAGSGTTAQAVMELNLEDGGNRQCICVQMPEVLEESSEAYKAGYRSIADITRARINKVIAKLTAEQPEKTVDLACANFTLAPSNFKVWRSEVTDATALREQLALFQSAEKDVSLPSTLRHAQDSGRTVETQTAMLTELLLKHGLGALGVHAITRTLMLAGVTVHRVLMRDDATLWLCFEPYAEALKDEIVKAKPAQVILLNSCFVGDKADELLANLQLELAGLDIGLTLI